MVAYPTPLKKYPSDIVYGLTCERKIGVRGAYLVFRPIEINRHHRPQIKWWIVPSFFPGKGGKMHFSRYKLYHMHYRKHSQMVWGKPHELITYIARHEAYEQGVIPPFSHKQYDLGKLNKMLKEAGERNLLEEEDYPVP